MIYVLDDTAAITKLIGAAFNNAGIHNYKLFNSESVMMEEFTDDVQIVVIDYWLNKKTGVEVLKEVKAVQPLCTPIFISNQIDIDVVIDIMNAGCNRYIRKDKDDFLPKLVKHVTEAAIEWDTRLRSTLKAAARINETIAVFENWRKAYEHAEL